MDRLLAFCVCAFQAFLACVSLFLAWKVVQKSLAKLSLWKLDPARLCVLAMVAALATAEAGKRGLAALWRPGPVPVASATAEAGKRSLTALWRFDPPPAVSMAAPPETSSGRLISSIDVTPTNVLLGLAWTNGAHARGTCFEIFGAPTLTSDWSCVHLTDPIWWYETNMLCEIVRAWEPSGFFRAAPVVDTDGDGLSDARELCETRTNPLLRDTDGDGLSDGEEVDGFEIAGLGRMTTDPLLRDTDGDGIPDGLEILAGSNPRSLDSDGDGIADSDELGTVTVAPSFVWHETPADARDLLADEAYDVDDRVFSTNLAHPVETRSRVIDRVSVDVNGAVHLIPEGEPEVGVWDSDSGGSNLSRWSPWPPATNVVVGAWWCDLVARRCLGSAIRVFAVPSNRCTVVEYDRIGRRGWDGATNDWATFQVVLPSTETGVVYVSYREATPGFLAETWPTLGVVDTTTPNYADTNHWYYLQWSCNATNPIPMGTTLVYRLGTGTNPAADDTDADGLDDLRELAETHTNPLLRDTDGDGRLDGAEVNGAEIAGLGAVFTDPLVPDTDGDGLPDGWEAEHRLDPRDPADGADADSDGDGLSNGVELQAGTDPRNPDTDGDGLDDALEACWIETDADVPWFDMSGAEILVPGNGANWELHGFAPPFTNRLAGVGIDVVCVDVNGVVHLGRASTTSELYSASYGYDMATWWGTASNFTVAAYWTTLRMESDSRILRACVETNGARWCVVECRNVAAGYDEGTVTFQVAFSDGAPSNTVFVRYGTVDDRREPFWYDVSLGAAGPVEGGLRLPYAYGPPPAAANGFALAYHFGTGGSPCHADTDGDGADDACESGHGTCPWREDSDGDGLLDGWEIDNRLDPLSSAGDDGRDGDPDGDGLPNLGECAHGTDPQESDTDGDTLGDGVEAGGITATNALPWLEFDVFEDLTSALSDRWGALARWTLPAPLVVQGGTVTNAVLDVNGAVYLVRAGGVGPEWSQGPSDLSSGYVVQGDALVVAPFWDHLFVEPGLPTCVRVGTATHDGEGYLLVECMNACRELGWSETNAISFQVAIPTNIADRAYVRYRDVVGKYMDGRRASVGFQAFGGRTRASWCFEEPGRVRDGLALQFLFGQGSDPLKSDTDGDGLDDAAEAALGTDPNRRDTDSDGMPDAWEAANGLDPLDPDDAALDPDGDTLSNLDEYLNQTDPGGSGGGRDSDDDGVDDGTEVRQGSDPNDPSDGGAAPPAEAFRELVFNIYGDYAAWEMTIKGLGPDDRRTQIISMGAPNAPQNVPKKLRKGNSYRLTMKWLNSDGHTDPYHWYCWQAQIDGIPSSPSYLSYLNERLAGNETLAGNGWVAENADGLLTSHADMRDPDKDGRGGGNVAGGLTATLHVLDVDVVGIKFNHDPSSCDRDAVNLRRSASAPIVVPDGEWTQGGAMNEPACYPGGIVPTVKVKFRAEPASFVTRARIRAESASGPLGGLAGRDVTFAGGESDWVEFPLSAAIPRKLDRFVQTWRWKAAQVNGTASAEFDADTTGPHTIYTTVADPKPPWTPNGTGANVPWTSALDFVYDSIPGARVLVEQEAGAKQVMAAITRHLFFNMGFRYDTAGTAPSYMVFSEQSRAIVGIDLSSYMFGGGKKVNCVDQSFGLATLSALLGCKQMIFQAIPYGYVNVVNLVGIGPCNNPAFESSLDFAYYVESTDPTTGLSTNIAMRGTASNARICPSDETRRSYFSMHTFNWAAGGLVFDACVGPEVGTRDINEYMHATIDVSTPNELRMGRFGAEFENQDSQPAMNYILK